MRPTGQFLSPICTLLLPFVIASLGNAQIQAGSKQASPVRDYGKLPLSFEQNQGQADPQVRFLSRGNGYSLFLTDSAAVLALTRGGPARTTPGPRAPRAKRSAAASSELASTDLVRMELAGASKGLKVSGADRLPGTANYFLGSDPSKWHSGVSTFQKVRYEGVYPGVDLVYYGNQRQLEYDFIVAPHANAAPIQLNFSGADTLKLSAGGDLEVIARNGQIAFHKPVVYQQAGEQRQPVQGTFELLAGNTVGFKLGSYDRSRPLVIDPVLAYSTYLGGSGGDYGTAIVADAAGNAYVTGETYSTDFPVTAGAFQTTNKGTSDPAEPNSQVFISKINPSGTALVYSTYLGGSGDVNGDGDHPMTAALDPAGNFFVAGTTSSTDFPVTQGAFQTANKGFYNGFVTKLNSNGTGLIYSTYLGGSAPNGDGINAIALDSAGNVYAAGASSSTDFPITSGVFQTVNSAAANSGYTGFVTKINAAGSGLLYSTFLGGSQNGYANGISLDSSGNAFVAGTTSSADFPVTANVFQTVNKGASGGSPTGFVSKINSSASSLVYSTYLGGSGNSTSGDSPASISTDASGNAYVAGTTYSNDFPTTPGAFQTANNAFSLSSASLFVSKLNPSGTGLIYSTYLGGSLLSEIYGSSQLAVDPSGNAYVSGYTLSSDFPVTSNAFQSVPPCSGGAATFVSGLNAGGTGLTYSTFLSGTGTSYSLAGTTYFVCEDYGEGITLDPSGNLYVTGDTYSPDFPVTTGAFQTANSSTGKAFVAKFDFSSSAATNGTLTTVTAGSNPQSIGSPVIFTARVQSTSGAGVPSGGVTFSVDGVAAVTASLDNTGRASYQTSALTMGPHQIGAAFAGNGTFTGSSGSVSETIAGAPASITMLYGSGLAQPVNTGFFLEAIVLDSAYVAVPNAAVTFSGAGLTFSPTTFVTGSGGVAYTTAVATAVGVYTATATVAGVATGATFTLTATSPALQFIPITPCRLVDTRNAAGSFGGPELAAGTAREFDLPQSGCGIPSSAIAYSLNATAVPDATLGFLTLWPSGQAQPNVSTLNSFDGRIKANAAITPAGSNGGVNVYVSDNSQFILDIDGYFVPAGTSSALQFFPVTPCRLADTRSAAGGLGGPFISGQNSRSFPVQSSACNLPSTAQAYSLNVTALPHTHLGYLTTWPSGQPQPGASTLNATTGAVTANAAIVPAGSGGDVSIYVSDDADVILDVNGYFAPVAAGGLSLYTTTPCRALDTRTAAGAFNGVLSVDIAGSTCAVPGVAQAYVLNATVVPPASLGYLSLWADGQTQPYVSTLNAIDGVVTSNLAIVPTSNGKVDAFSSSSTQAILDVSSYFAP